jgi:hypothetical protein
VEGLPKVDPIIEPELEAEAVDYKLSFELFLPDIGPAEKLLCLGNAILAPSLLPSCPRPMLDYFDRMTGDIPSLKELELEIALGL